MALNLKEKVQLMVGTFLQSFEIDWPLEMRNEIYEKYNKPY